MKKLLIILSLLLATATLSAQNPWRRGFAFGADRDTLLYIIASPFDNWYISVGGKAQTFIGNEQDSRARWNMPTWGVNVEVGKWLIPDVAVALRLSFFDVRSQGCYEGRNPWLDKTATPFTTPFTISNGCSYYPMHMNGLYALGIVIFDWTNFLSGYETGKRNHLHIFTPVGLGGLFFFGKQINPSTDLQQPEYAGKIRWNKELGFTAGIAAEYITTRHLSLNIGFDIIGTKGTIDWTYSQDYPGAPHPKRYIDWIPSFTVGVKFNLLKSVNKFNPYTRQSSNERVNHEFLAFGTRNTVANLTGRIDNLYHNLDSVQNLSDQRSRHDSTIIALLNGEIDRLQQDLDSVQTTIAADTGRVYANMLEEIIAENEKLNLPVTIVYFKLDHYDLDFNGHKRLQNFAKRMAVTNDTIEYYIIGAADSATGTVRHNKWLSERRCESVFNILTGNYGADRNRLTTIPVGGINEYEPQENNRMAIVIRRDPAIDRIILRWTRK